MVVNKIFWLFVILLWVYSKYEFISLCCKTSDSETTDKSKLQPNTVQTLRSWTAENQPSSFVTLYKVMPSAQTYSLLHICPDEGWGGGVGNRVQHPVSHLLIPSLPGKTHNTRCPSSQTVFCLAVGKTVQMRMTNSLSYLIKLLLINYITKKIFWLQHSVNATWKN